LSYKINEVFRSLQGEGRFVGVPAIFIRFSGCLVRCPFCDTDHDEVIWEGATPTELIQFVESAVGKILPGDTVVLTGGEPLLQVDPLLLNEIRLKGVRLCLETSGSVDAFDIFRQTGFTLRGWFDTISVSPKIFYKVSKKVLEFSDCLKVVWPGAGFYDEALASLYREVGRKVMGDGLTPKYIYHRVWKVLQVETVYNSDVYGCGKIVNWQKTKENFISAEKKAKELFEKYGHRWRVLPQVHVTVGVR
jgi:organic radical activating enzyme